MKISKKKLAPFILVLGLFALFSKNIDIKEQENEYNTEISYSYTLDNLPEYSNEPYVILDNNIPDFSDITNMQDSFETYSELDKLGRCGVALANLGIDLMPTEKRKSIGSVYPSGWHSVKYDNINGKYLYNRCHLIGYQLTGENANPKNLITCTANMNTEGMLPFENKISEYIKRTKHHVLYRVTPIFKEENLLADGVIIEAKSVEDEEISFKVFVYNVQDGISIDYKTGDSHAI